MRCSVYKSPRKSGFYLYVPKEEGVARIPAQLQQMLGPPEHVLDLDLTPERRLAKEDPQQVLSNLRGQGYHLQVPDPAEKLSPRDSSNR